MLWRGISVLPDAGRPLTSSVPGPGPSGWALDDLTELRQQVCASRLGRVHALSVEVSGLRVRTRPNHPLGILGGASSLGSA